MSEQFGHTINLTNWTESETAKGLEGKSNWNSLTVNKKKEKKTKLGTFKISKQDK